MLVKRQSMGFAILLGVAIGLGLLAKQAMIYVVLCVACHAIFSREAREALKGGRGIVAAADRACPVRAERRSGTPSMAFPPYRHTEANIGWQYPYVHPLRLLEYVVVQFGVFGPILIDRSAAHRLARNPAAVRFEKDAPALLLAAGAGAPHRSGDPLPRARQLDGDRLSGRDDPRHRGDARAQSADSVPHLARAASRHRGLAGDRSRPSRRNCRSSSGSNSCPASSAGAASPTRCARNSAEDHYGSILVDTREMAAELLYYLRDVPTPLYVWPSGPMPNDQYEMTRPLPRRARARAVRFA